MSGFNMPPGVSPSDIPGNTKDAVIPESVLLSGLDLLHLAAGRLVLARISNLKGDGVRSTDHIRMAEEHISEAILKLGGA